VGDDYNLNDRLTGKGEGMKPRKRGNKRRNITIMGDEKGW